MNISAALARLVRDRAQQRCEYCGMSQSLQGATFHVEHIIPLTCPSCNLHKSDRSHAMDPDTQQRATIFHPRRQRWADEFRFEGTLVIGHTATGRATIQALDLNHPRRIRVREAEALFGLFPP